MGNTTRPTLEPTRPQGVLDPRTRRELIDDCEAYIEAWFPGCGERARALLTIPIRELADFELLIAGLTPHDMWWVDELWFHWDCLITAKWRRRVIRKLAGDE